MGTDDQLAGLPPPHHYHTDRLKERSDCLHFTDAAAIALVNARQLLHEPSGAAALCPIHQHTLLYASVPCWESASPCDEASAMLA
jgi:hypothetical protein